LIVGGELRTDAVLGLAGQKKAATDILQEE
jgi:hypothetical protein